MVNQGRTNSAGRKPQAANGPARTAKQTTAAGTTARRPAQSRQSANGPANRPVRRAANRRSEPRQSPAVYRRRRLLLVVVLLMALALVAGGIAGATGILGGRTEPVVARNDGSKATQAPAQGTGPTASPTATPNPSGCDLNQVTVTASTDKAAYAAGENPLLSMKVTNGGSVACDVNLGTSQMEFLVMSGADRIFSSRDCQAASEDLVKTIEPGKSETANFPWQRNRSVEGCSAVLAKPGGGGATYVFTARLGNKQSQKAVFQLG